MKKKKIIRWSILTCISAFLLAFFIVGTFVADFYQALINSFFDLRSFEIVNSDTSVDTNYYKSDFLVDSVDEDGNPIKELDEFAYNEYVSNIARQTAEDGAVLLWNHENENTGKAALPIEEESSVSLFGKSTYNYNYCVDGSGFVKVQNMQDMKSAFEDKGFSVNKTLYAKYASINAGLSWCTAVGEVAWNRIYTSDSNFNQYGDNAIFIITRRGCEGTDMSYKGSEGLNGNILDLNPTEIEILDQLVSYRKSGVFKNLVVLISSSHAIQFSELSKYEDDIDACMWVGMGGKMANSAIVNLLSGAAVPSGRLTNVYAYNNFSNPVMANFGEMRYANASEFEYIYEYDNTHNMSEKTAYIVYEEGIYVGYRYYESRYEDVVMGKGNADSTVGVAASNGAWNYAEEVKYPFGYGTSYTTFEYSDFSASKKAFSDDYEIQVTVTNTGSEYTGREVVQVYLQKPYTDYDKTNGIEKSAIELVGFAKTGKLAPGASETVTITVNESAFKTYDANRQKTYILEKGDYYLAVGTDSHDALNNILAAKGYKAENGMVNTAGASANGDSDFVYRATINADDYEKYSKSEITGEEITNQFDDVDINKHETRGSNSVTYLSRNDWENTYPQGKAELVLNAEMAKELEWDKDFEEDPNAVMPLYEQPNNMKLIMLKGLAYDNEYWDDLLDQMSFADQALLVTRASGSTQAIPSVDCPGTYDLDGPQGLTKFYNNTSYASGMCYPCQVLMGATFDVELIEAIGRCFGEDMLCAGQQVLYGPGANIQRSPYSGRNGEYYSEDPYLTKVMLAAEVKGLMEKGVVPMFKHFALNDQETNRHCLNTWSNEQAVREIYLEAFYDAICYEKCTSVMASFNSLGTEWASAHKGLLTNVLRGEWGFEGYVSTDGADMKWMSYIDGLMAGNDIWMSSGDPKSLDPYKDSATFCQILRESAHRIMYALVNSNAMNGMSANSKIVPITNWWQHALVGIDIGFGVTTFVCVIFLVLAIAKKEEKNTSKK